VPEVPAGLGLCSEPALMILVSLAEGALDGHGISRRIGSLGGATPTRGTLYGILARLEARGLIESQAKTDSGARRERPYALTESGLLALRRWLGSLQAFAVGGLDRLARVRETTSLDLLARGPVEQRV
jgi:DNA-binding PadR family transcriptional regulator